MLSAVDNIGQTLMNVDLDSVLKFLLSSEKLLVVAFANIIIVDTLLWFGGFGKGFRYIVAFAILVATLMKMKLALLLFNLIGLPLMLALAVSGIFLKILLSPFKAVKKGVKKR